MIKHRHMVTISSKYKNTRPFGLRREGVYFIFIFSFCGTTLKNLFNFVFVFSFHFSYKKKKILNTKFEYNFLVFFFFLKMNIVTFL